VSKLKTCPFCGEKIGIHIMDAEGNMRDESYLDDPWSGVSYSIKHYATDENSCPIAGHEDESVGIWLYNTKEELIQAWNRRADHIPEASKKGKPTIKESLTVEQLTKEAEENIEYCKNSVCLSCKYHNKSTRWCRLRIKGGIITPYHYARYIKEYVKSKDVK